MTIAEQETQRVRVEVESEVATSNRPARVLVHENGQLVAEVFAEVELKQGADGGYYHCVTFKKKGGRQCSRGS